MEDNIGFGEGPIEELIEMVERHNGVVVVAPTLDDPQFEVRFATDEDSKAFTKEFFERNGTSIH